MSRFFSRLLLSLASSFLFEGNYYVNGNEYVPGYSASGITWSAAESHCQSQYGTNLASIHSIDDHNAAYSLIPSNNNAWIGLNDITTEGTFVWSDGTPFDFDDNSNMWRTNPQEPNGGTNENCVLYFGDNSGKWIDITCAASSGINYFLCNAPSTTCRMELYEHSDFGGLEWDFETGISYGIAESDIGHEHGNWVSSYKYYCGQGFSCEFKLCFDFVCAFQNGWNPNDYYTTITCNSGESDQLRYIGDAYNDDIEYIEVSVLPQAEVSPYTCKIELFEHENFGGTQWDLTTSSRFGEWFDSGDGYFANDQVTSYKIYCGVGYWCGFLLCLNGDCSNYRSWSDCNSGEYFENSNIGIFFDHFNDALSVVRISVLTQ